MHKEAAASVLKNIGLNVSPYTLKGQDPNTNTIITESHFRELLEKVQPYTNWVRFFGMTNGLENGCRIAHELGMYAAVGIWLSRDFNMNEIQIESAIATAKRDKPEMVIVGSETLLRKDLTEDQLVEYIKRVRSSIPSEIPVTTADVYYMLLARPKVLEAVDVVMANFYPYFEGSEVEKAVRVLNSQYRKLVQVSHGKKVMVSETGWPSCGKVKRKAIPSPKNARSYFLNVVSWARANDIFCFYFEAFNEPWKARHEGLQGSYFGLWSEGKLMSGIEEIFKGKTMGDNWSSGPAPVIAGKPTIQIACVPRKFFSLKSFEKLQGCVLSADPMENKIIGFVRMGGKWWVKPYSNAPGADINPDGYWEMDITTSFFDIFASEIFVAVVPKNFKTPILLGERTIPSSVYTDSIAHTSIVR